MLYFHSRRNYYYLINLPFDERQIFVFVLIAYYRPRLKNWYVQVYNIIDMGLKKKKKTLNDI